MNNKLFNKIIQKAFELYMKSEGDLMIYGNSYLEFSERKMELLKPEKVIKVNKNIIHTKENSHKNVYGKSILEKEKEWKKNLK